MNFITGLSKSEGKSAIFVVMAKHTKYAHFYGFLNTYIANQVT